MSGLDHLPPAARHIAEQNPDALGVIGEAFNEHGTPVTVLRCSACRQVVTVCPAVPEDQRDQWSNCLAEQCPSYDITRDVEVFWDALAENGLIEREDR